MSLPTISVIGNMKRIELKYTQSGKAVCSFQIECAEKNAKGEWTNLYLKGECWEKQAEFVNQYFRDGSVAIVTGKLYTNVYEKQDGSKVYENKLLFPSVSFAPKEKAESQQQYTPPPTTYENVPKSTDYKPKQQPQQPQGLDVSDEDIPF